MSGLSGLGLGLEAFLAAKEAVGRVPLTLAWYRGRLQRFLAFLAARGVTEPAQLTAEDCEAFEQALRDTDLKPNTLAGYDEVMRVFIRWMARRDWAPRDVMLGVDKPKRPELFLPAFSDDDVAAMVDACRNGRDRALILFLLDTGVRASELCALVVADVNVRTGGVAVRHGKGNKGRLVGMSPMTKSAVLAYLKGRGKLDGTAPLWATDEGGPLQTQGLRSMLRRLEARSGVRGISPHRFRRTCATTMARNGANAYYLMAYMGHESYETTKRYIDQAANDGLVAIERFSPVERLMGRKGDRNG